MKLLPGDHVAQKDLHVGWHGECTWGMKTDWCECVIIADKKLVCFYPFSKQWNVMDITKDFEFRTLTPPQILEEDSGWFERGELPPVGIKCEHKTHKKEVFIVAHHHFCKGHVIFSDRAESGHLYYGSAYDFRPLKSDRDKAIEAAYNCINKKEFATMEWQAHAERIIVSMIDAGFKLPEGESDER